LTDERIFEITEDDYGILNLHDDEQNDLPFHPVPSDLVPTSSKRIHGACCTCLNTIASHIFVPCGHLCICSDCVQQLEDRKCPLCRNEYIHCIRVIMT